MATFFQHVFTAANGTKVTEAVVTAGVEVGWYLTGPLENDAPVYARAAKVHTNKMRDWSDSNGPGGNAPAIQVYVSHWSPLTYSYKVRVRMLWEATSSQPRDAGPGVRVSEDGLYGYFLLVDLNNGAPIFALIRRLNGVNEELVSWRGHSALTEAALLAGRIMTLRVQTMGERGPLDVLGGTEVGVNLQGFVGTDGDLYATKLFDFTDDDGNQIGSKGSAGLWKGTLLNDFAYDDVVCYDFEDEAPLSDTPGDYQDGIGLYVDGVYLNEQQQRDRNLSVIEARDTYNPAPVVAVIRDDNDAGRHYLKPGDWIGIRYNNNPICYGRLRRMQQQFQPPEGTLYEVRGVRSLSDEVIVFDPLSGENVVSFNEDEASVFMDPSRQNLTIGDILQWVYDYHEMGQDGLRAHGAAPSSGALYDPDELAGLDAVVPNIAISGSVQQVEETLLAYHPEYAIRIDPVTLMRHFVDRSASPFETIDTADGPVTANVDTDLNRNRTVIFLFGSRPEALEENLFFDRNAIESSTLQPTHTVPPALWNPKKKWKNKARSTITAVGTETYLGGTHPYVDLAVGTDGFALVDHEWQNCWLQFVSGPKEGQLQQILDNVGSRVYLTGAIWLGQSGIPPDVGDAVELAGADSAAQVTGDNNGFFTMGRMFSIGANKGIKDGVCGFARIAQEVVAAAELYTQLQKVAVKTYGKVGKVELDVAGEYKSGYDPITGEHGLEFFPEPGQDPCKGGYTFPTQIEIDLPVYNLPEPKAPFKRWPQDGFRGTAFSYDTGKWDVDEHHGIDDCGVMTPLVLNFPNYKDPFLQDAEYEKVMDSLLKVYGTIAHQGTFILGDTIATDWIGLDKRVQFTDSVAPPRPTKFEGTTDFWVGEVVFNFEEHSTTVVVGNLAFGEIDLEAIRARYAANTRYEQMKRANRMYEDLLQCMKDSFHNAALARPGNANDTPACDVRTEDGTSLTTEITKWRTGVRVLDRNKGAMERAGLGMDWIREFDEAGVIAMSKLVTPLGGHYQPVEQLQPDGVIRFGYTKEAGGTSVGLPGPDIGGFTGNAARLHGLTFDGRALPGSGPGAMLSPGSAVPQQGAYYYPPSDGTEQPQTKVLQSGHIVPAPMSRHLLFVIKAMGLTIVTLTDPGGPVFSNAGNNYRLNPNESYQFQKVNAVTAGTGLNGGDYDYVAATFFTPSFGVTSHGDLTDLDVDDHEQYALLEGRSGGQELNGGTDAGDELVLRASAAGTPTGYITHETKTRTQSSVNHESVISPAQITANQNNYAPTGLLTARVLRINSDAARSITGIDSTGLGDGRELVIFNVGAFAITLQNLAGGSSAANQFAIGTNLVLAEDQGCILWYDATSQKWRCHGKWQ